MEELQKTFDNGLTDVCDDQVQKPAITALKCLPNGYVSRDESPWFMESGK